MLTAERLTAAPLASPLVSSAPGEALLEGAGVVTSLLCVVHCVGLPLVLAVSPTLGAGIFQSEWFHMIAAVIAGGIALSCFQRGYQKHLDFRLIVGGFVGAGLLFYAAWNPGSLLSHLQETRVTVLASFVLIATHALNYRLSHPGVVSGVAHDHDCSRDH